MIECYQSVTLLLNSNQLNSSNSKDATSGEWQTSTKQSKRRAFNNTHHTRAGAVLQGINIYYLFLFQ